MQAYHLWFKHLHLTCISLSRFFILRVMKNITLASWGL
ncbi:MAG: hypothetical protein RIS84_812 [Pseudomonadota bacterium]|jgi:hypothetical protein